ncbi:MAG TPA: hypothetical protein PKC97_07285 [Burkholderiaceae bacterium]|nr:hypothetical protein [Burkholderiaceae bacterium]
MALAIALGAASAQAQPVQPPQIKDIEAKSDTVKVAATVAAVDQKNRIVTFVGPEGNTFAVDADDSVRNLAQVKVGDNLVVEYYEAVALDFQKGDGIRMATSWDDSARTKAGKRRGAAALSTVTLVSNIWAVNPAKGTVLVHGPFGHLTEVRLKDPSLLGGVKLGDQMKVTYTQAVAFAITKP